MASFAKGIVVDQENQTYTATAMGVQVSDQLGRTRMITPLPDRSSPINIYFGGKNNTTLFAVSGTGIFSRNMVQKGAHSWDSPTRPTKPFHIKP